MLQNIFWYPSPDVCLDTILSQSSMGISFDLMAWFLLWHALSTVEPYIDKCVITYSQEELLNIKAMSTYHHYDQEYVFPEADPLLGVAFQRDIGDCNILCSMETWLTRICCQSRYSLPVSSRIAPTETNISHLRRRAGVYALWLKTHDVIKTTYRNSCPFFHLT